MSTPEHLNGAEVWTVSTENGLVSDYPSRGFCDVMEAMDVDSLEPTVKVHGTARKEVRVLHITHFVLLPMPG